MANQQNADLHLDIDGKPVRVPAGQRLTVGRGTDCDVTVSNAEVSRRHAEFSLVGSTWVLRDLGSSNGTYLDGRRVTTDVALRAGSVVQFGGADGITARVGFAPGVAQRAGYTQATSAANGGDRFDESTSATSAVAAVPAGGQYPSSSPTAPIKLPKAPPRAPDQRRPAGDVFRAYEGQSAQLPVGGARTTIMGAAPQVVGRTENDLTIGRGVDNDIVIKDLLASRRHARLRPNGRGFDVEDLGSRNGTYINGSRVVRGMLGEDDLLAIGHTRFTVKQGNLVASEDQGDVSFVANHLSFTLPDGKKLLDDISFGLEGSSLVAVIGPSGAGKSTLLKALIGAQKATEGEVYYDGRDLYDNYDDLRHRIGVVPQDDVVHHQLTVRKALRYAAELRFPDDLEADARNHRVDEVIEELGLTNHADTTVAQLSGGQRKRTSVALELLTQPSLLFLDEPTSGLDPGLDKRVMETLRGLADGGRTVVVITHNVASLGVCDRVLMLAPGGKVAFFGPPHEMLPFFNADDHADVFNIVTGNPEKAQQIFAESPLMESHVAAPLSAPRRSEPEALDEGPRQQSIPKQLSTLVRRQFKVMFADRGFMGFMLLLPMVLAALAMITPGTHGLRAFDLAKATAHPKPGTPMHAAVSSGQQIMTLLVMGAVFMGLALTIRELVAERPIFLREKAVGLSTFSYLWSKVISYGALLVVQCAIMVGLVVAVKHAPSHPVVLGNAILETFVLTFLTGLASIGFGLLLSSFARTSEQVMPMLVITIMGALVFSGGLFHLPSSLEIPGYFFPSRWGLAMGSQTANVPLSMSPWVSDPKYAVSWPKYWEPARSNWLTCCGALAVQFFVTFAAAYVLTRRRKSM